MPKFDGLKWPHSVVHNINTTLYLLVYMRACFNFISDVCFHIAHTCIHIYISVYECKYITCLYLHKTDYLFLKCTQRMMKQMKQMKRTHLRIVYLHFNEYIKKWVNMYAFCQLKWLSIYYTYTPFPSAHFDMQNHLAGVSAFFHMTLIALDEH